jgi:S1-C subfamily serine protease
MTNPVSSSLLQDLSQALGGLVGVAAPSIVAIHSHHSRSSGFIWRSGLIVTADEALAEEGEIAVSLDGGDTVQARLAGRDLTTDIALLRIDRTDLPLAPLRMTAIAAGSLTLVVGAEDGRPIAALGVVSRSGGAWRSLRGGEIDARLELDVSIRRRAEGGLVLGAEGHAIGMAVFGPRRKVLVIPAATIERVAPRLESHGRIARGYLGLGLQPVTVDGAEGSGAMVMSVDPRGPGATAGIHQGDILIAWNGEPIRHVQSLLRALGPDSVGQAVTLRLSRAGETQQVSLLIAERPAA